VGELDRASVSLARRLMRRCRDIVTAKCGEAERRAAGREGIRGGDERDGAGRDGDEREGAPALAEEQVSEGVRVGEPRTERAEARDDERASMAAIFAEMAAHEQLAKPAPEPRPDEPPAEAGDRHRRGRARPRRRGRHRQLLRRGDPRRHP